MSPRVSIVIPTYNNADYVAATMDSVLAQTYPDVEVVVADHSSTDATPDILARYAGDPRVRLEVTPAGGGAERNWNRVTDLATGEYLKLVCGDDLLHPEILAEQVAALDDAGPDAVMVASRRDLVDARGEVFLRGRGLAGLSGALPGVQALRATVRAGTNIFGEPMCTLLRRQTLVDAGGWDGTNGYYIDAATYARVLVRGTFVALPRSLASFRVSASQWSVALMAQQYRQAVAFHAQARALAPGTISAADERRGNLMARVATLQRRAAYLALGRRMRPV